MTSPKKEQSVASRFLRVDSATPITDEEADALLKEAGIDSAASLKILLDEMADVETREKKAKLKKAALSHDAELRRLNERSASSALSRAAMLQQMQVFQTRHPSLSVHFRNLNINDVGDEELREMLAELEELVGGSPKK